MNRRKKRKQSTRRKLQDEMRPEYDFDYSEARPNRFATLAANGSQPEGRNVLAHDRGPWGTGKNAGAPKGRNRTGG